MKSNKQVALIVKEDGLIYLKTDTGEEVLCADQEKANKLIRNFLRKKEIERCSVNVGTKERPICNVPRPENTFPKKCGIYPIPDLQWEEKRSPHNLKDLKEKFKACNHPKCDCVMGRDGELNCDPTVAILRESTPSNCSFQNQCESESITYKEQFCGCYNDEQRLKSESTPSTEQLKDIDVTQLEESQEELTVADLKAFIDREFGGYKVIHIGHAHKVINRQFIYESDISSLALELLQNFTITRKQ